MKLSSNNFDINNFVKYLQHKQNDWRQEKGVTEDEMVRTKCTWTVRTGEPGGLHSGGHRVGHDTATEQ